MSIVTLHNLLLYAALFYTHSNKVSSDFTSSARKLLSSKDKKKKRGHETKSSCHKRLQLVFAAQSQPEKNVLNNSRRLENICNSFLSY